MPFKCGSCGLSFDTAEEFIKHKLAHQEQPKSGLICLGCGKPIPVDPSKANYKGDILCPSCGQVMEVTLKNGEVIFAMSKAN